MGYSLGDSQNSLTRLVIINLIVFITLALCRAYFFFFYQDTAQIEQIFRQQILQWFALPGQFQQLLYRPWTLLSAMFTNVGVWMVLGNMLWLWAFGFIFQDLSGNRKIIALYLYGGVAGSLGYLLASFILPDATSAGLFYGAAPSVMAVAIATTMLSPYYRLFPQLMGGFPLWVLTVVYVLVSVATKPLQQPLSYLPLLAGGAMGFVFMQLIRMGYDLSDWMNRIFDWANDLFNPEKPKQKKAGIKEIHFYKATRKPFDKKPRLTQERIDALLEKIHQKGMDSLTQEEKEFLERASQSNS
ncbi:MAG TPA: rhomboid family intramembrane serine protease [Chitinophagaceae bacterium]|nr:rhomboid family intramembrane serine protease [Chitinophagaceae bacterium]